MKTPTLVLLPGFSLTQRIWEKQLADFKKHFEVLTPDLPGHGRSPALREPTSLQEIGKHLADFLKTSRVERYAVLGWSMGGMIAQHMALDYPEAVEKLILVGSSPQFVATSDFPDAVRPGGHAKLKKQLSSNIQEGLAEFLRFATKDHVLKDHPEYLDFIRSSTLVERESVLFYMDALLNFSITSKVSSIKCPTLIISGVDDPLCPLKAGEYLANHIPTTQFKTFPNCGHFPFLTHTREFNDCVIEFLGDDLR